MKPFAGTVVALLLACGSGQEHALSGGQQAPADGAGTTPSRSSSPGSTWNATRPSFRGLTQFGDRRQGTRRNRDAVDWIEAQLEAAGCPTERHHYVYDPPPRPSRPRGAGDAPLNPPGPTPTGGRIGRNGSGPGGSSIFGYRRPTGVVRDPLAQPDEALRALNLEEPTNGERSQVYCTKIGSHAARRDVHPRRAHGRPRLR